MAGGSEKSWEQMWDNIAYDVYRDIVGEEEYKAKLELIYKNPSPPGLFSGAQFIYHTKKLKFLYGLRALQTGQRTTHPTGIGAYGTATILSNPQFPECDFFTPGASYPVRLRHSKFSKGHDGEGDLRAASLKFADSNEGGPLDVIMMTGSGSITWNVPSLYVAMISVRDNKPRDYLLTNPEYFRVYVDCSRRAPDSYCDQRYHSHVIFDFKAKDGVQRYARFRMKPADDRPETGFLKEAEWRKPWDRTVHPTETRPADYLDQDFKERLSKGSVEYRLQIQLHEVKPDDSPMVLYIGRGWDETTHPWIDLAHVTLTSLLPSHVTEKMRFLVDNLPLSLDLLPLTTMYQSNCIPHLRKEVYRWTQMNRMLRSLPASADHMAHYVIRVQTGTQRGADTDAKISVTLFGTNGRTDALVLDKWFYNDFEKGRSEEYTVEAMDVGEVLMLQLHNDGSGWWSKSPDVFVTNVSVISSKSNKPFEFPTHRWLLEDLKVFQSKALLPQQEQAEVIKFERKAELVERQKQYQWGQPAGFDGLPGCINATTQSDLPRDSQLSESASKAEVGGASSSGLFSFLDAWDDFESFKKIFSGSSENIPKVARANQWMKDHVFGMQFLNGCNPCVIRRCVKLPSNFPVTDEHVMGQLKHGVTLKQAMESGHVYIVDYKELEEIERRDEEGTQCYTAEPLGLFYVNSSGDMCPIAIQLFQQPSDTNPIWTPSDSQYDWLLAKMWLRNADYQVHQIHSRLLNTHLLMEAVAVATMRQLSSVHPVFKLLFPHVRSVMTVNTIGREKLNTKGSQPDLSLSVSGQLELMKKKYKQFKFGMLSIPDTLKERGVDDAEKLPNFHYRDDALRLWEAIGNFVKEILSIYYKSDDDIKGDNELQAWTQDIHQSGYQVRPGHVDHEFPKCVQTRDELVRLITCVVFNCSCQHAAVTYGQFEVASFVPNTPPLMRRPPPTEKGTVTLKLIMETLPNRTQAGKHIDTVYATSRFAKHECYLGDHSDGLFAESEAEEAIDRFQRKLQEISEAIRARNENLEWPYTYLLPERVPQGITV